jgi:hypothetical protein
LVYAVASPAQREVFFEEQIVSFCKNLNGECNNGLPLSITGNASAAAFACNAGPAECTFYIFENNINSSKIKNQDDLEARIKELNEYIGELSVENKFFKKN